MPHPLHSTWHRFLGIVIVLSLAAHTTLAEQSRIPVRSSPPILDDEEDAEPVVKTLKPKHLETSPKADGEQPLLKPRRKLPTPSEAIQFQKNSAPLVPLSLSLLLQTPLINQNAYDARFQSFGGVLLFGIPLLDFSDMGGHLFVEFGGGATFSSLKLQQPDISFSHLHLIVPVRARIVVAVRRNWFGEAHVGFQSRLFEYDSRPTLDGGFRIANPLFDSFDPDLGVGVGYRTGKHSKIRVTAGYLYLGAGIEFGGL